MKSIYLLISGLFSFFASFSQTKTQDYNLVGRFILKDANCAGFEFKSKTQALWRNEIACQAPTELRLRWIDKETFATIHTESDNEECPPRVEIYKVVSYDGKKLTLKQIWTGWNDFPDDTSIFNKQ